MCSTILVMQSNETFFIEFFFFLIWSRIESLISWRLGYLISVELDLTFSYAFSGLETATKAITLIHQGCWHVDRKNSRADVKTGNLSFRINPVFRINFFTQKKKKKDFSGLISYYILGCFSDETWFSGNKSKFMEINKVTP